MRRITAIPNPVLMPGSEEKAKAPLGHPWFQWGQPPAAFRLTR
jgi:hypothetical protein